jgi:hypothetical protein
LLGLIVVLISGVSVTSATGGSLCDNLKSLRSERFYENLLSSGQIDEATYRQSILLVKEEMRSACGGSPSASKGDLINESLSSGVSSEIINSALSACGPNASRCSVGQVRRLLDSAKAQAISQAQSEQQASDAAAEIMTGFLSGLAGGIAAPRVGGARPSAATGMVFKHPVIVRPEPPTAAQIRPGMGVSLINMKANTPAVPRTLPSSSSQSYVHPASFQTNGGHSSVNNAQSSPSTSSLGFNTRPSSQTQSTSQTQSGSTTRTSQTGSGSKPTTTNGVNCQGILHTFETVQPGQLTQAQVNAATRLYNANCLNK